MDAPKQEVQVVDFQYISFFYHLKVLCMNFIFQFSFNFPLLSILQCTEGRQPSVRQLLILLSMKTREVVSKNATFP